jgi:hypothetical protein
MTADEILALAGRLRALDITDEHRAERRMAELLAKAGITATDVQAEGGRMNGRWRAAERDIRRIVIEGLLFDVDSELPKRLRDYPAGQATIDWIMAYLEQATLGIGERALRGDIAAIRRRRRAAKKSMH